jgi:hypothetical protein
MQEKHKVTLYLPNDLHRQLKIRSAVDGEAMSYLAEQAIDFFLTHSDVIEKIGVHGQAHRVYDCPHCSTAMVIRDDELVPIESRTCIHDDDLKLEAVPDLVPGSVQLEQVEENELVPC